MLNLEHTINSGQVFLWERYGSKWYGIHGDDVLLVDQSNPEIVVSYSGEKYDLFRQSDNFNKVIREIVKDAIIKEATKRFAGMRLLRQDPFQCYISFIVSANSNIQNIRLSLYKLAKKFGKKVRFDGKEFFLFPDAKKISSASISGISSCGLGYRAKYVHAASEAVRSGAIDLELLKKSDYHTARDELCKIDGIGNKVADCIMLFSLEKTDAFPLDRWMLRALHNYYPGRFTVDNKSLTERRYHILHDELREYFGTYAGYCQQFLFKMIRDSNQKRW
ncbi:MAG: DNA glycosylase [Candidatus Nitrosotenuis sp.]